MEHQAQRVVDGVELRDGAAGVVGDHRRQAQHAAGQAGEVAEQQGLGVVLGALVFVGEAGTACQWSLGDVALAQPGRVQAADQRDVLEARTAAGEFEQPARAVHVDRLCQRGIDVEADHRRGVHDMGDAGRIDGGEWFLVAQVASGEMQARAGRIEAGRERCEAGRIAARPEHELVVAVDQ